MRYQRDFTIGLKETRDFYQMLVLGRWWKGILGFGVVGGLVAWMYLNWLEEEVSAPAQVLMIPQYLWYQKLGWVGSYKPLIIPYFFAIQGFFVYQISNFIDGIPRELDEAAKIDGCSYYSIFFRIVLPLITPALITSTIFSFMWRWDDFLSALLYINESAKYPVSLALKLFCDPGSSSDYGAMFAMATLSIMPAMIMFFCLQKYLVEGISTSGLKG